MRYSVADSIDNTAQATRTVVQDTSPDQGSISRVWLSEFRNNSAALGGAYYAEKTSVQVVRSLFLGNFASAGGGAIYLAQCTLTQRTCLLTGNAAGGDGGAVGASDSELYVTYSTIAGNRSGAHFVTATPPDGDAPFAWPQTSTDGDTNTFTYRQSDRAASWNPTVEGSIDLLFWDLPMNFAPGVSVTIIDDGFGTDSDGFGIDQIVIEVDSSLVDRFLTRHAWATP